MAVYTALSENNYQQVANMGIPESLIPQDAAAAGYALTRNAMGGLEAVNVSALSGAKAKMAVANPEEFTRDGDLYRCDIADSDITAQSWVDVLPVGDDSVSFCRVYGEKKVDTYDGGFAIFADIVPGVQLTLTYRTFAVAEGGN